MRKRLTLKRREQIRELTLFASAMLGFTFIPLGMVLAIIGYGPGWILALVGIFLVWGAVETLLHG